MQRNDLQDKTLCHSLSPAFSVRCDGNNFSYQQQLITHFLHNLLPKNVTALNLMLLMQDHIVIKPFCNLSKTWTFMTCQKFISGSP